MVDTGVIEVELEGRYPTAACEATERVMRVAAMFGIGVDEGRDVCVVRGVRLRLARGRVVLVTGASGGGKTTLLRLLGEALGEMEGVRVIRFGDEREGGWGGSVDDSGMKGGVSLVDGLGETLEEAVRWLSLAGLNDAWLMVRGEGELSAGQGYRWGLARVMAEAESGGDAGDGEGATDGQLVVVLIDEFVSLLDRQTAGVVARNVRKWADRSGVCVVVATAHDDVLEAIEPDVLVVQEAGEGVEVLERGCDNGSVEGSI